MYLVRVLRGLSVATLLAAPLVASAQGAPSWAPVEQILGRKAVPQAGDVMRFNFPRTDLHVTVAGVQIKPSFALGSWVAFKRMPDGNAMAMGDLVLLESEINPVISALQQGGVEQTALHNHLLGASPAPSDARSRRARRHSTPRRPLRLSPSASIPWRSRKRSAIQAR